MTESHLKALRALADNSVRSQRLISEELNLSLGTVNGIISALIEAGCVRRKRLRNDGNRGLYEYVVTPRGARKRMELAREVLKRKSREHETLVWEIEELKEEIRSFNLSEL